MNHLKQIFAAASVLILLLVLSRTWHGNSSAVPTIIRYVELNDLDTIRDTVEHDRRALQAVDIDGHTALHIAAEHGNTEIVNALLSAGADPNRVDREGFTPLAYSLLGHGRRRREVVRALIDAGARTDVPVPDGVMSVEEVTREPQAIADRE